MGRPQEEMSLGRLARPKDPDSMADAEWADYLFNRTNPKGVQYERWAHSHGCRRWFNVARHTVTDRILAVYRAGEPAPKVEA